MILNERVTLAVATLLALVVLPFSMAAGDPPPPTKAQLPEDGTWVRYHVLTKRVDQGSEWTYKLTTKLVGTVREGDQVLRWVELEFVETDGTKYVEKYLIPEKSIFQGDNPAVDTVRGWSQIGEATTAIDNKHSPAFTEELLLLPGPLSRTREFKESKTLKYQKGELDVAQGLTRNATAEYPRADGKATRKIKLWTWVHEDIPLGVVAARTSMLMYVGETQIATVEREYEVEDIGTGAKSTLTAE